MNQQHAVTPPSSATPIFAGKLQQEDHVEHPVERLPFTIKRVETAEDMRKAV